MTNMARPLRETGVAEGSFNRHAPLANRREERGRGVETSSVGRGGGGGREGGRSEICTGELGRILSSCR